jgi:hypothetical protein
MEESRQHRPWGPAVLRRRSGHTTHWVRPCRRGELRRTTGPAAQHLEASRAAAQS